MSYKTIVVHVDRSIHANGRMQYAAQLAARTGAHLVGSAFSGISRYVEAGVEVILAQQAAQREGNEAALARFDAIAVAAGVDSHERRHENDEPAGGLVLQARYADLVVLSQTDPGDPVAAHLAGPLPAQVVLGSARPVLAIPYAGQFTSVGARVLVAWDGSMEASRAVSGAMPLLRAADMVAIVLFNPAQAAGRHPGADLALYLARHGVRCEVHVAPVPIAAGAALLSCAADLQSDLIVMGAYGHARLREVLLGGVTETILGSMTAPVLMAH
jgi:nucleotide-binding universal stress UspA family protein